MFSWGQKQPDYPGRRGSHSSSSATSSTFTAQPIVGSIRPPHDPHSRRQHLDSYLNDETLKRSTRKVSSDDSTYDTVFQSIRGDTLILRVHWPASAAIPAMTLAGVQARHAWLDSRMRVIGYEPLQSVQQWRDARLLLGQAVHAVVKHLQLQPPEIVQITDAGLRAIQPKTTQKAPPPPPPQQRPHSTDAPPPDYDSFVGSSSVPEIDMPDIPTRFPALDDLSREKLDELLSDELAFLTFCNNKLPILKTYHSIRSSVIDENAVTAQQNVDKYEEQLSELHESVSALRKQLKERVEAFQKLEKKQDEICKPPDMRTLIRELVKAKKEAFDASEQIAEEWLNDEEPCDNKSIDAFVQEFMKERIVHHQRAAKEELLRLNSR